MDLAMPSQHRYSVHAEGKSVSGVRRENWSPSLFSQNTQTTENESVTPVVTEP